VTADLLAGLSEDSISVDASMSTTHIQFAYERLIKSGKEITAAQISSFFDVAVSKCMLELVKAIIDRFHPVPTITQFLDYCLPPKPDHPEVEK
jgi:hypothetical protein